MAQEKKEKMQMVQVGNKNNGTGRVKIRLQKGGQNRGGNLGRDIEHKRLLKQSYRNPLLQKLFETHTHTLTLNEVII